MTAHRITHGAVEQHDARSLVRGNTPIGFSYPGDLLAERRNEGRKFALVSITIPLAIMIVSLAIHATRVTWLH